MFHFRHTVLKITKIIKSLQDSVVKSYKVKDNESPEMNMQVTGQTAHSLQVRDRSRWPCT